MPLFKKLTRKKKPERDGQGADLTRVNTGRSAPTQDTWAAIDELSKVVKNNPESVEIYLALGNLYRSQGETERAVHIRNSLIVRPGLAPELKARASYELGRDFKRGGFLDRALKAFNQARDLAGDKPSILMELARLHAEVRDYGQAAQFYSMLDHPQAQAHYLVRQADEKRAKGDGSQAAKLIKKAIRTYPGSPEARLAALIQLHMAKSADKFKAALREALDAVNPKLRFLILEGLLRFIFRQETETPPATAMNPESADSGSVAEVGIMSSVPTPAICNQLADTVLPVLATLQPDVIISFYGGFLCNLCGDVSGAKAWLEKALVLHPDFWLARLELLSITSVDQDMAPFFKEQLDFFIDKAKHVKRFVCQSCGMKRQGVFYVCPKCLSWHSVRFRMEIAG